METVDGIQLFTKLLDGGGPIQCACGHIWRFVPNVGPNEIKDCPACGRGLDASHNCTMEDYKNDRKENT